MARIDLSEFEKELIQPLLPNTSRGAARVEDRRDGNDVVWLFRTG